MVNTLELRGIETYSPEIQTFLREIEKSFLQVLNNCVPADQERASSAADILELFVPTFFHRLPVTQLDIPMTPTIIHGARTPILKPSS